MPLTSIAPRVHVNLEKRFSLWLLALLVGGCGAYLALGMRLPSDLITASIVLSLGVAASSIAHYSLFKPIRQLVSMARAVGAGDFSKRLGIDRADDIGSLALEMDTMCDQLQAAQIASEAHIAALEQLRHSDRVATLGRLASSVAHELGNPLNVIELRAHWIASGEVETLPQAQQSAEVIVEQTRRMTRIINEILSFARVQPANIARIDLASVLRNAVALSAHTAKKQRTSVAIDLPLRPLEIDGDADKLLQVFVNLLMNGMQAMPRGGTLHISTFGGLMPPIDDPEGEPRTYVGVDVRDEGEGIEPDMLAKVFVPFFSTKGDAGGTGLGLSVAQGIVREHEGWISATSEPGRGSSFKVYLPTLGLKENLVVES